MDHGPMQRKDMDVVRDLFALRFVPGGSNGLVELYVEDDGLYHFKQSFDQSWLPDLIATARAGQEMLKSTSKTVRPVK